MRHPEWLWASALLALLFVGYGLIPAPRGKERADSFDEDGAGKKAFFLLAESLLPAVRRSTTSLVPEDPSSDTLVILGPARYPDRAQWQTLHDWVSDGRSVVFAARFRDPAVELEPFGIRIVPTMEPESDPGPEPEVAGDEGERNFDGARVETGLVEGEVDWRSLGQIRYTDLEATVLLYQNDSPQVLWQPVGQGSIIVVSSDFIFTNRSLTNPDNGVLAFRILEMAEPDGPVYFDERMNAEGAPKVVGILFEDPFRLLTLQLLVITLLFGWMVSRRFGPLEESSAPARRSLVEHAQALGSLHYQVGTGGRLVASYLELFRRPLGLHYGKGESEAHLEARDSAPPAELTRALRASKSPAIGRETVASIIASLARYRATKTSAPTLFPEAERNL